MNAPNRPGPLEPAARETLLRYARVTWESLAAMTDHATGLPADKLGADGQASVETSITNIGAYLWSVLVAARLGIIGRAETGARLERTLTTLATMERHAPSGQFYNWYNRTTGERLTTWPFTGAPVNQVLSSVDNGWLATGLHIVAASVTRVSAMAQALFDGMDFGCYYRPALNQIAVCHSPEAGESGHCYDTIVSESRIASYIGIATGRIPAAEYFGSWRTFPRDYDRARQKAHPVGTSRTYLGVEVFEGTYAYDGMQIVPGWGGSMFEALMPALFVPEDEWGPNSWAINHPLTVAAQIHHGLVEAGYGYWGFSPSNAPEGGYREYGVSAIAMNPDGYASAEETNLSDDCSCGADCAGSHRTVARRHANGVVTPHASFLALRWAPDAALANLAKLERDFAMYDRWGFRDSVNVGTGRVSDSYLSLDQGIIMAAIGNALCADMLRRAFATPRFRGALKPIISIEKFNAAPRKSATQLDLTLFPAA